MEESEEVEEVDELVGDPEGVEDVATGSSSGKNVDDANDEHQ